MELLPIGGISLGRKRVGLIFHCPEKVNHIERMCRRVNYEDIVLTIGYTTYKYIETPPIYEEMLPLIPIGERTAKVSAKFGSGWIGKNAEIRRLDPTDEEPEGILVIIRFFNLNESPLRCWIKNLKDTEDTTLLGEVEDILCEEEGISDEDLRTIRRQLKEMGKTLLKRPIKVAR
jgi:hypothetical protein